MFSSHNSPQQNVDHADQLRINTNIAAAPLASAPDDMAMTNDDQKPAPPQLQTPPPLPTGLLAADANTTYIAMPLVFDSITGNLVGIMSAIKLGKSCRPYTRFGVFYPWGNSLYIKWTIMDGFLCQDERTALSLESLLIHLVGTMPNLMPFAASSVKNNIDPLKVKHFEEYASKTESFAPKEHGERLQCNKIVDTLVNHCVVKAFVDAGLCARLTRQQVMGLHQTNPPKVLTTKSTVTADGHIDDESQIIKQDEGELDYQMTDDTDLLTSAPVKPTATTHASINLSTAPGAPQPTVTTRRVSRRTASKATDEFWWDQPVQEQQVFAAGQLHLPPGLGAAQDAKLGKGNSGFTQGHMYYVDPSALRNEMGGVLALPQQEMVATILEYSGPAHEVEILLGSQTVTVTKLSFAVAANKTQPIGCAVFFWSEKIPEKIQLSGWQSNTRSKTTRFSTTMSLDDTTY